MRLSLGRMERLRPLSSQSLASMLTRELTSGASIPISGIVSPTSSSYRKFFPFLFLTTLASSYNYQCFTSILVQPQWPRICAVLSRLPSTTVVELSPGYAQLASVGALSFINIHAPADNLQHRDPLFASLHPHLVCPSPPSLLETSIASSIPLTVPPTLQYPAMPPPTPFQLSSQQPPILTPSASSIPQQGSSPCT